MALTVGELTGYISLDDREVDPALRRAEGALRASGQQMTRDSESAGQAAGQALGDGLIRAADGSLRDARGRFAAAGRAAGDDLADGIGDGAERAGGMVRTVTTNLVGLMAALPAVAAVTTAGLGLVAAFAAAGLAVKAFQLAAGPQMDAVAEASASAEAAEAAHEKATLKKAAAQKLAAKGGDAYKQALGEAEAAARAATEADAAMEAQMKGLPPATRETAKAMAGLKDDHQAWSDSLAGSTMPVYTKGIELLRRLLPMLTPLVKAAAKAFGGFLDEVDQGVSGGGVQRFADTLARFAGKSLSNFLSAVKNIAVGFGGIIAAFLPMSDDMSGGLDDLTARFARWGQSLGSSQGFADFVTLAREGAATLGTLAGAVGRLLVAMAPVIGVTAQIATWMAVLVNNTPAPILKTLGLVLVGVVVGMKLYAAGSAIVVTANRLMASSTYTTVAAWLRAQAVVVASSARMAAASVATGARVVGAWLLMGAQALMQGARMAAAWVIAMGPVGWVIAAIVGLGILIWKNWDKIIGWTTKAWDWIWGKIKSIGGAIVGFFVKWSLVGIFLRHWDSIRNGVVTKGGQLVTWVKGLPGRIINGIGSLNRLLYDKGKNVVQGLWSGIQGMSGWIKSKIMGWAKSAIPDPIAKALGIHSPSRVTKAQGRWIARGLIDGLLGSSKQIKAAAAKAAELVTDGLRPGKKRSKALGKISSGSKKLLALANRETKVAAQLKAAQKRLTSQIEARNKLATDVRNGVLESGNITSMDGPATADTIINTLAARVAQAQLFAKQLAELKKKGVRADLISQIATAGVEQGAASAAVLANASAAQVKQINGQQAALVKAAGAAGNTAGDAMYGAGIQAARGLVRGLQNEQKSIERQMLKIATGMQKAIRQALGIKSPSRVMAAIGRFIPQGLVRGIDGERAAVDRSLSALVDPSAVPVPTGVAAGSYGAVGGTSAPGRTVIEIRSSGSRRDDLLLEELRHAIRVRGGDVQLVLAGKK
ncbi:hypothetical protein ACIQWZ_12315 [Streptomyces sp. NPDC098077]|uniref:phage tail protein n=1 Tax=Streptomyces sp. NPDC098077 TaxID=3366093 RepID=UPI003814FCC6